MPKITHVSKEVGSQNERIGLVIWKKSLKSIFKICVFLKTIWKKQTTQLNIFHFFQLQDVWLQTTNTVYAIKHGHILLMGRNTKVVQILLYLIKILVDFGAQQKWMMMEYTFLDLKNGDIVVMIALLNQVKITKS